MRLELKAEQQGTDVLPSAWRQLVEQNQSGFVVRGDLTAAKEIFLSDLAGVVVADCVEELVKHVRSRGVEPKLSVFGVSALLQNGLVPPPFSEFEGIYNLTTGDVVRITWPKGKPSLDFGVDYPWFADRSRNDGVPDEDKLLELLTLATVRDLDAGGGTGFLMMSSGKDSVALALALAEAGRTDIPGVTYGSGDGDPEPKVAALMCKKLGIEHRTVELPRDPERVAGILTGFFERSARPGADLAQIPYVLATAGAGSPGGVVLDGGGNDAYMGYPVTGKWARKTQLRIRGRRLIDFIQRHIPVDSPLNYVARTRAETVLSGRMIRFHESQTFLPNAANARDYWEAMSRENSDLDLFDFYTLMERYLTPQASAKKHVLSALAIGHEPQVPWCDNDIADYYFNLPEEHRYDKKNGVNKVLLRRMLLKYLDYDSDVIGKHYFTFDGARFVVENKHFVRDEINSCALWDKSGLGQVNNWLDTIEQHPYYYHALLTMLMVSGWHNHSRLLAGATGVDLPDSTVSEAANA